MLVKDCVYCLEMVECVRRLVHLIMSLRPHFVPSTTALSTLSGKWSSKDMPSTVSPQKNALWCLAFFSNTTGSDQCLAFFSNTLTDPL